jgi:hypothetical protein
MAMTEAVKKETIRKAQNGIALAGNNGKGGGVSKEQQALYDSYNPARGGGQTIDNTTKTVEQNTNPFVANGKPKARMLGANELAGLYGIDFDENSILNKFNTATKAEYDQLKKEFATTENKFYNNVAASGATALDTIRKNNAAAVATGASRGMQAANELSSLLGLEQESVLGATDLANQRNQLMDKEAAAYAQNAVNAMDSSNKLKQGLATIGSNLYAADTQFDVGQMDYFARLDAAAKQLAGMNAQANATVSAADISGKHNENAADITGKWNNVAAGTAGDHNVQAADKTGWWNNKAAETAGKYNVQAQQALGAAQRSGMVNGQESYDIQNDKYLNKEFSEAYALGNYERIVQLKTMMNPGMDRKTAEKIVQSDKTFMGIVNGTPPANFSIGGNGGGGGGGAFGAFSVPVARKPIQQKVNDFFRDLEKK